jgi:hypothetical protein
MSQRPEMQHTLRTESDRQPASDRRASCGSCATARSPARLRILQCSQPAVSQGHGSCSVRLSTALAVTGVLMRASRLAGAGHHRLPSRSDVSAGSTSGSCCSCAPTSSSDLRCSLQRSRSLTAGNAAATAALGTLAGCMLPCKPLSMMRRQARHTSRAAAQSAGSPSLRQQLECLYLRQWCDRLYCVHAGRSMPSPAAAKQYLIQDVLRQLREKLRGHADGACAQASGVQRNAHMYIPARIQQINCPAKTVVTRQTTKRLQAVHVSQ